MRIPAVAGLLGEAQLLFQIAQDPQVVQRMHLARDELRHGADAGALRRRAGQQGGLGVGLLEVFDDGHRLDERALAVGQRRNGLLRIDARVLRPPVVTRPQVQDLRLVRDALQVQHDADPERRGRSDRFMELHRCTSDRRLYLRGGGPSTGAVDAPSGRWL